MARAVPFKDGLGRTWYQAETSDGDREVHAINQPGFTTWYGTSRNSRPVFYRTRFFARKAAEREEKRRLMSTLVEQRDW